MSGRKPKPTQLKVVQGTLCSAKPLSQLISLDLGGSRLHAPGMKILLMMVVVQSLNLVVFTWLNRVAFMRILGLRQQLCVYKRKLKPPKLRNRDHPFWSLLSMIWRDWRSELILAKPETVIRWRDKKFREFWRGKSQSRSVRPPDSALADPRPLGGRLLAIPVLNGLHHEYRPAA